ncbi:MAG: hypothetical protein AABY22_35710 [Nanoarchaeota archaeon]
MEDLTKKGDVWETSERKSRFKIVDVKDYYYVISFLSKYSHGNFNMPKDLFFKKYYEDKINKVDEVNEIKIKPKSKAQIFFDKNIKLIKRGISNYLTNDDGNPFGKDILDYLNDEGINLSGRNKIGKLEQEDVDELEDLVFDLLRQTRQNGG